MELNETILANYKNRAVFPAGMRLWYSCICHWQTLKKKL